MRRNGYSLTLRPPKLAYLSGSLCKKVASPRVWKGLALATPKNPQRTTSSRRQFAIHKNSETHSQLASPEAHRRALGTSNQTSGDNPLSNDAKSSHIPTDLLTRTVNLPSSNVVRATRYKHRRVTSENCADVHGGRRQRPSTVTDAFRSSLEFLC